ncbi:MAG: peptidoglycan-binding protein [Eubacteriales bacterium]|nr:peptidoglycan-binding protein [Eubacteriales bacterium]
MNTLRFKKIFLLFCTLCAVLVFISSCYVEPDRTIDGDNNIGNNNQNFETLVTPTPTASPEPTATPVPTEAPSVEPDKTFEPILPDNTINLDVFNTDSNVPRNSDGSIAETPIPAITGKPTTKPTATPKPTVQILKNGAEGARVKELQKRLKQLGYYSGKEDGKFGAGTEEALKNFQSNNKIKADGIAGNTTLKTIYSKNPVKANTSSNTNKINNTSKSTNTNTKKTDTTSTAPRLKHMPNVPKNKYISTTKSTSGTDVKNLQNRLIDLGYLVGTADGVYGAATEKAIISFQKANLPYADGVVGPDTFAKLYSNNPKKSSKPVAVVAKPGESLRLGDTGEAVRALQKRLIELGFLKGSADGSFGPTTQQAIEAFQAENGITADGIAGSETLNILFTDFPAGASLPADSPIVAGAGRVVSDATPFSTGYSALNINDTGSSVLDLQSKLQELGIYKGQLSGTLDEDTREAIIAFQKNNFLMPDGIAGPAMQRMLFGTTPQNAKYSAIAVQSEGLPVLNLQYSLYELGYFQDQVNAVYAESTESAVKEFQTNNQLEPSGVADERTLAILYSSFAKPAALESVEYATLNIGQTGDEVIQLQVRLKSLGYIDDVSGEYDEQTVRSVLTFQTYNNLTPNGVADEATQMQIFSENAIQSPN